MSVLDISDEEWFDSEQSFESKEEKVIKNWFDPDFSEEEKVIEIIEEILELKPYICDLHPSRIFINGNGTCLNCKTETFTSQACYCKKCSAEFRKCQLCARIEF